MDIEARKQFIKNFPCFALLTDKQSAELASLMEEVVFTPQQIIVRENDIVDAIYIIQSGEAEVTREAKHRRKIVQTPVAALRAGEGIGLNDTGFYSATGKRTATVTAVTHMTLLRLDLKDLYSFLKQNNLELSMYAASLQMLRMRFIKQSLPFAKISHERLRWLADHVEEKTVPSGSIIFKQGEQGDKCYLIRSGQVNIIHKDEQGNEKELAILKPPVLFGEATLITHTPRNASAISVGETELLVLSHQHLSELIESEDNVANMFMTLMVDRSRPSQNPMVSLHQRTSADGQEITILKNPENGNYFKLSAEGAFIWDHLDGSRTMQDITLELAEKMNVFAPDVVAALISKLTRAGFIDNLELHDEARIQKQPAWVKLMLKARRLLEFRYAFGDADKWVSRMYQNYIKYFFTKPSQIILWLLAITGIISFAFNTQHILQFFMRDKDSLLLIFALIPLSLIKVMFHELGHAFAVKAFGREVHYIGIGWYWLGPVAFTDTTDMWLATRKPRMMVNLAGVFVDISLASLAALAIFTTQNLYLQSLLWLFAAYTYYGAFKMMSPLQELDGYYVLMDWLEKNRLRQAAVIWLVRDFPKCIRHPSLFKNHWPEVIYWLACIVYIMLIIVLTLVVLKFIFALFNRPLNLFVSLCMPFVIVGLSSLSIIADMRNQRDE